jgi:ribosome-binding protein aMBF1 (putative translation factor)
MSNTLNEQKALDGGSRENNVITQAEFRAFQHETQQTLQAIQVTLARLTIGNNQQREDERVREDYRERIAPAREHNPIPCRQLAYEEEISDDEEYAERILRPNRQGYHNMGERGPQQL